MKLTKNADATLKMLLFIQIAITASIDDFQVNALSIIILCAWLLGLIINARIIIKFGRN